MRTMRWAIGVWMLLSLLPSGTAGAIDVTSPPAEYFPAVFITAFQHSSITQASDTGQYMTDSLDFFELYNETDEPLSLQGWSVVATDAMGDVCRIDLNGWILPDSYVAATRMDLGVTDGTGHVRTYESCGQTGRSFQLVELRSLVRIEERIIVSQPGAYVRKGLTKTYRSGTFTKDFALMGSQTRSTIYAGEWYEPSSETVVRIVELLPRSRQCAPNESTADCRDFVKIYNPSPTDVDLQGLRLRIGYQGQSVSSSNSFALSGIIGAGEHGVIAQKNDGSPIAVTNDGGYVWLEDTYGIQRYDATIVEYPSAESDTKIGWAWAYETNDATWRWTSTATPYNQASVFTLPETDAETEEDHVLQPCAPNQYRNPLTNRCRLIAAAATATAKPCAANQYRHPTTNRCRLLATASSGLTPCQSNQYRNPATNRCRTIATASGSNLKPCATNQERNPTTNRCRGIVNNVAADFPVEIMQRSGNGAVGWWAFGGVGILAAGYAAWEWRREFIGAVIKAAAFVTSRH